MKLITRYLIVTIVLLGIAAGDGACQVPEFATARLYRCRIDMEKPRPATALAPVDDNQDVDTPGVQILPAELCIIRQLFLELPGERRHRDTVIQYGGIHLVNYPDFLVTLLDERGRMIGTLLVEQDHQSAEFHDVSGNYRTLPVQHMQIELFLQLTAMHQLDR